MKNWLPIFLIFVLLITGCIQRNPVPSVPLFEPAQNEPSQQVGQENPPRIALVMKTLTNPFFIEMEKGARQAEQTLGIQLIVKTAAQETSIEQQINIVEELIEQKVDAIVIAPGDSISLIPVLKKAQDAGIIVINIDNRLDEAYAKESGLVDVPFISVDNENGAYLSAKVISDQITQPTQVAILEGIREARNAQERKTGALRAFRDNPNIQIVASETAHWKIDEGYEITRKILEDYPDLGAIFCANDMMALGAIQALDEAAKTQVLVAGYDALDEAQQAVKDGKLIATIDQQAMNQGYMGIFYAVRALKGEKLPKETMLDVIVVTRETLLP